MSLNAQVSAERVHIGFFGRRNAGKSSVVNAVTGQELAVVSDVKGTTTDPVKKSMELLPLGPVVIIDTPGIDDEGELGLKRVGKTRQVLNKADLAVLVVDAVEGISSWEEEMIRLFEKKEIPYLVVYNKMDLLTGKSEQEPVVEHTAYVSARTREGIQQLKEKMARLTSQETDEKRLAADLVKPFDTVILVVPIDKAAPKGRLILPQVQTLRELLDKKCLVMSVTTDQLIPALAVLKKAPKLIITDSQVFGYVYENKPAESMLTSFSVLFAAYKGDLPYYVEGAEHIDALNAHSRILIAECCTHAPLKEDIGREKIPRMLRKRFGESLAVDIVSGTDFPKDLSGYDLIIQCGACMFNRKYVMSRIGHAREQGVPMTNYGVTIAHLTGILDKISMPET